MERSCGLMNKKPIRGVPERGERARNREAPTAKATGRRSDSRAAKDSVLTWGSLASRPKGRRPRGRSEMAAKVVVATTGVAAKDRTKRGELDHETPT